jgi:hypothetical protein
MRLGSAAHGILPPRLKYFKSEASRAMGPAQSQSLHRNYKGNLECGQAPPGSGILRTPLVIIVRDGDVLGGPASIFDIDGKERPWVANAAAGRMDTDGAFHLGHITYMGDPSDTTLRAEYTGTFDATGGTLTGTQVWNRAADGRNVTSTCKGTFVEVTPPKP